MRYLKVEFQQLGSLYLKVLPRAPQQVLRSRVSPVGSPALQGTVSSPGSLEEEQVQPCEGRVLSSACRGGGAAPALPISRWVTLGKERVLPINREETKIYSFCVSRTTI